MNTYVMLANGSVYQQPQYSNLNPMVCFPGLGYPQQLFVNMTSPVPMPQPFFGWNSGPLSHFPQLVPPQSYQFVPPSHTFQMHHQGQYPYFQAASVFNSSGLYHAEPSTSPSNEFANDQLAISHSGSSKNNGQGCKNPGFRK